MMKNHPAPVVSWNLFTATATTQAPSVTAIQTTEALMSSPCITYSPFCRTRTQIGTASTRKTFCTLLPKALLTAIGPRPARAVMRDAKRLGKDVPTAASVRPRKLWGMPQYLLISSEPKQTTKAVPESQAIERRNAKTYHRCFDSTLISGMVQRRAKAVGASKRKLAKPSSLDDREASPLQLGVPLGRPSTLFSSQNSLRSSGPVV
mmetsp:Transcript_103573/g.333964  ORF Transcript_103573/g.333964 Transcript_103573/m.333964 type:complete len:206 (+) Transcript_103573:238-855(+)